jgi:16S rRNA (cytosine1402-N4)-methyltransferase
MSQAVLTVESAMQNRPKSHQPVLLNEVLRILAPRAGGIYVDGTFGGGGYTRGILESARCSVYAIDRDPRAIEAGAALIAAFPQRLSLIEGLFSNMGELLAAEGVHEVDGIVLDIGVSSMQLDEAERGFSFQKDGPLDMRMGRTGPSAADVVNSLEEAQLKRVIAVFGEERRAQAIARAIARRRREQPFTRTGELAQLIQSVLGRRPQDPIHPATRTFQALRIFVNRELEELAEGLSAAEKLLKPGGRLAVVTFHSLEDRIVKRFLVERSGKVARPSRHQPAAQTTPASFELLGRQPVTPGDEEVTRNPRARSAKLRAAVRTAAAPQAPSPSLTHLASIEGL